MELIKKLKEVLKQEYNITTDEGLMQAIKEMPALDIGIFVNEHESLKSEKSA